MSNCTAHAACTSSSAQYCASVANWGATGMCRACSECAAWADAIDGVCPTACGSASPSTGVGASSPAEFYNAFGYWNRVKNEGSSVISTACVNTAAEAMRTTSSYKKGRNSGCAPVFTKADTANRWCDVEELTLRYPFQQCIATASNNYCGIAGKSVCIADKYYDCCPLQKDVVAGVAIAVGVALCIIQWAIYRSCYTRKLIKRMDTWSDPAIVAAAHKAALKHPKLSMRIRGSAPAPAPAPALEQP